jgi:hypothetical protein
MKIKNKIISLGHWGIPEVSIYIEGKPSAKERASDINRTSEERKKMAHRS